MSVEGEIRKRIGGKIILEAVANEEGNMIVNAPDIPADMACKILAGMIIDLILQTATKKSDIITPEIGFKKFFRG